MLFLTYINDGDQGPYGAGSVLVLLPRHVLREAAGHNNDIISYLGHLFDGQVHQSTQGHIFRLEQLRHRKESLRGLCGGKMCALGGAENVKRRKHE